MKIAVIGGGPAGIMAAAAASSQGANTMIIEQNPYLGKKMGITGKGRCNITNACDIRDFIANIPVNGKFMHSAFYAFSNEDMINLLLRYGVETKIERGNRVFPVTDKAKTVIDALKLYAKDCGVRAVQDKALSLKKIDGGFLLNLEKRGKLPCDRVIIATGGASYTATGSTGDGYAIAKRLGHTVVTPKPSLVPLTVTEEYVSELEGLSLRNIEIKIFSNGKKPVYTDFGEMVFTKNGVSGPVILSASANLKEIGIKDYKLYIDLKPALDEIQLDKRILRDFEEFKNKNFSNALDKLLPKKIIPIIIGLSGINPLIKVNEVTKEQRRKLLKLIKNLPFTIDGTGPIEEAIITSGGINVKEINPSTMESKLIKGLYFAGEVIDVDAYTGGFNLQIAFSTGYLAGTN